MAESSRQLSPGDKSFLKLIDSGERPSAAFRVAFPEHPAVVNWNRCEPGSPDRQRAAEVLKDAAKNKLRAKYMQNALTTYQDKMEQFSELSVQTAIDLVRNARSEKVRADLAIEGIRHKIGTPVQKVAVQEQKTVVLTFEKRPQHLTAVEGEVVDAAVSDELDAV